MPDNGRQDGENRIEEGILSAAAASVINARTVIAAEEVDAAQALFLDGYEGYFDQHKQREKISTTPFSRAPSLDAKEFIERMKTLPEGLLQLQDALFERNKTMFNQWALELYSGYNLMIYGLGSKRELINNFIESWDTGYPIIIANGFNSATNFKDILNTCVLAAVPQDVSASWLRQPSERLRLFLNYLEKTQNSLVLVLHSMDGIPLRDDKSQEFLSRLASSPHIKMIASVDHLNAPILWDSTQLSNLRLVWHNCPTYKEYTAETSYMDILSLGQSPVAVGAKVVFNVLSSLTSNAQKLYKLLVMTQYERMVEAVKDPNTPGTAHHGVEFRAFYQMCAENFIVSNEMNFKILLTEFFEHKMADKSKDKSGAEILYVPYTLGDLEQIINDIE